MLRISDAIRTIVSENPLLQSGFSNRLFNLTRLAQFLKPLLEARTKKDLQESAILMNLSRLQRSEFEPGGLANPKFFELDSVTVNTDLSARTYHRTPEVRETLYGVYSKAMRAGGFATLTEGISEITVIIEASQLPALKKATLPRPLFQRDKLASIGIKLGKEGHSKPGLLYLILQQLAFQNINIVEIASTASEFIIYLSDEDVQLGFETLFRRFSKGSRSNR